MKKNIGISMFLCIAFLASCSTNSLNVTPLNELSDATFWKSEAQANLALTGCYSGWESWTNITMMDGMTDIGYSQFFQYNLIAKSQFTPTTSFSVWMDHNAGTWFSYYRIRKYNNFLQKIKKVPMSDSLKEEMSAEVRFLRCYDYYNKVMLYGAVPLVTSVLTPETILPRTPVKDIEKWILGELDTIGRELPVENNIQAQGHVTAGAAYALKARLELYMGDFSDAIIDAKKVIDMGVYELYPTYSGLFTLGHRSNDKETILSIDVAKNYLGRAYIPNFFMPDVDGGYDSQSATKKLVDTYEMSNGDPITDPTSGYDSNHPFKNRDPRLYATILYPGEKWNGRIYNPLDRYLPDGSINKDYHSDVNSARGGTAIIKWMGDKPFNPSDYQDYDYDVPVIRLAGVYLIYAEAAEESGTNMGYGLELLNMVRTRAGMPPATQLTRSVVRYERTVELAYEGLRYYDIKRWNIGPEALNGPVECSRNGTVDYTTGQVIWKPGYITVDNWKFDPARNYLLPIPQSEIDISHWQQNPGY